MHVHYVRKSTSNIKLRRYALLTGPKRCKYLRAQIDLDRRQTKNGQAEEPEMLGNGQQVVLVRLTKTKFYLKTSFISMAKINVCQWMEISLTDISYK